MNTSMKVFITSAMIFVMILPGLAAATVTTQMVSIDIEAAYTGVAAIRVFDGATVNPTITFNDSYQGTYQVSDAGMEATKSDYANFDSLTEKEGGALQYTVAGLGTQQITVHSGTSGYNSDSLYVILDDPRDPNGLYANGDLGTVSDSGDTENSRRFAIEQNAKTVLYDIPGTNAYTGTALVDIEGTDYLPGAAVTYGFNGNPGVTTIGVTYTILGTDGGNSAFF